jgi:hypothetical protein
LNDEVFYTKLLNPEPLLHKPSYPHAFPTIHVDQFKKLSSIGVIGHHHLTTSGRNVDVVGFNIENDIKGGDEEFWGNLQNIIKLDSGFKRYMMNNSKKSGPKLVFTW